MPERTEVAHEIVRLRAGNIGVARDAADIYRLVIRRPGLGIALDLSAMDCANLADALLVVSEADRAERRRAKG